MIGAHSKVPWFGNQDCEAGDIAHFGGVLQFSCNAIAGRLRDSELRCSTQVGFSLCAALQATPRADTGPRGKKRYPSGQRPCDGAGGLNPWTSRQGHTREVCGDNPCETMDIYSQYFCWG